MFQIVFVFLGFFLCVCFLGMGVGDFVLVFLICEINNLEHFFEFNRWRKKCSRLFFQTLWLCSDSQDFFGMPQSLLYKTSPPYVPCTNKWNHVSLLFGWFNILCYERFISFDQCKIQLPYAVYFLNGLSSTLCTSSVN